jgi:hypothetical protein
MRGGDKSHVESSTRTRVVSELQWRGASVSRYDPDRGDDLGLRQLTGTLKTGQVKAAAWTYSKSGEKKRIMASMSNPGPSKGAAPHHRRSKSGKTAYKRSRQADFYFFVLTDPDTSKWRFWIVPSRMIPDALLKINLLNYLEYEGRWDLALFAAGAKCLSAA